MNLMVKKNVHKSQKNLKKRFIKDKNLIILNASYMV